MFTRILIANRGEIALRIIRAALLFELSLVTRPAYEDAQAEARHWGMGDAVAPPLPSALRQWRL